MIKLSTFDIKDSNIGNSVLFLFIWLVFLSNTQQFSVLAKEDDCLIIDYISCSKWLNGADAAITFSWDDTDLSHLIIASIMEEYGFKGSFFVYPGRHNGISSH